MKTFDLKQIVVKDLSSFETEQLLDYLTTLPFEVVVEFFQNVLDEFSLCDDITTKRKISNFLSDKRLTSVKNEVSIRNDEWIRRYEIEKKKELRKKKMKEIQHRLKLDTTVNEILDQQRLLLYSVDGK